MVHVIDPVTCISFQLVGIKWKKLITKPGESFEKDEDITTGMDNIIETIISKGTQSVMATNKSLHAHDVEVWWGEIDSQNK